MYAVCLIVIVCSIRRATLSHVTRLRHQKCWKVSKEVLIPTTANCSFRRGHMMKVVYDMELPGATKVACDRIERCSNVSSESAPTLRLYQFSFYKGWTIIFLEGGRSWAIFWNIKCFSHLLVVYDFFRWTIA